MPNIIRDLADTSSYWAAIWTMCPLPDVHVICDAPIGCFNLVATAVPDYTDSVPHIENVTPSVITENEVGGTGTGEAVKRTYEGLRDEGMLDDKHLIVVSTAESEMIGSDLSDLVTKLKEGTTFFHSESLTDDEWVGRDRVLQWLWEHYGEKDATAENIQPEAGLVNIIGPTYGNFNSPSDLHEVKRLIEAVGGTVNVVFPYESTLSEMKNLAKGQVNIIMYHEYGEMLAESLGQPYLHAPMGIRGTTEFLQQFGELLGTSEQAEAFIQQEKRTTLQAVWDLWRGPQSDWFNTLDVGIVSTQTYTDGLASYLGDELGMKIAFKAYRGGRSKEMDNDAVRQHLHNRAPAFVYGSINERIYLAEAGARSNFIWAAFPGAYVCRSIGTPFMGYRGTVVIIQEIVNRLYETLFNFLPVDGAYKGGNAPKKRPAQNKDIGNMVWSDDAKAMLDAAVEHVPFIARISASRQLQMDVEDLARERGLTAIDAEIAAEVLVAAQPK